MVNLFKHRTISIFLFINALAGVYLMFQSVLRNKKAITILFFIVAELFKVSAQQAGMREIYGGGYIFDAEKYKVDIAAKQYLSSSSSSFTPSFGGSNFYSYRPSSYMRKLYKELQRQAESEVRFKQYSARIDSLMEATEKHVALYSPIISNYMSIHAYDDFLHTEKEFLQQINKVELVWYSMTGKLEKLENEYRTQLSSFHMLALVETGKYDNAIKYYQQMFLARDKYGNVNRAWEVSKAPFPLDGSYHIRYKNDGELFQDTLLQETDYLIADLALAQTMGLSGMKKQSADFSDEALTFYRTKINYDSWLNEIIAFTYYFSDRTDTALQMLQEIITAKPMAQTRILVKISKYLDSRNINPLEDPGFMHLARIGDDKYSAELITVLRVEEMKKMNDFTGLLKHYKVKRESLQITDSAYYTNHNEYLKLWEEEVRYLIRTGNKAEAESILKKAANAHWLSETQRINYRETQHAEHLKKMEQYNSNIYTQKDREYNFKLHAEQIHKAELSRLQCVLDILLSPVLFEEKEWDMIKRLATPYKDSFSEYTKMQVGSLNYVRPNQSNKSDRVQLLEEKCAFTFKYSRKEKSF